MSEGKNPVRDRTLVLRVLVPGLEARLREKMEDAAAKVSARMPPGSNAADYLAKESLADLDGVTCEPSSDGDTKWRFYCDGCFYPARLVNLPCPIELHKTHDHATYYKSCDVAQIFVVYEDEMAMEEAEAMTGYKSEDYPSYYHSGLTPPMKRVVERRFEKRDIKVVPPPRTEVSEIEEELRVMIDRVSDSSKSNKGKSKTPSLSVGTAKLIEEVEEEIVDYQPWMDDYGRQPNGIQFDADDPRATKYPELWLEQTEVDAITQTIKLETEKKEDKKKQKAAAAAKKKSKKNSKKESIPSEPIATEVKAPVTDQSQNADFNVNVLDTVDMDDTSWLDLDEFEDELGMDGVDPF
mmetsp:Transcript_32572/g.49093  ORF Transcript_32572/g.49093 Transcript_32572/m.49093 type:complete len:352 (-) Transcript_32572:2246-3301(-)